ncbi:MAG: hypothetical protein AAF570_28855, partial [Bacteroidota bacterium]
MRIHSLEVEYPSAGWKLERTEFDDFTLLVGASGMGKSRILESIHGLQMTADGDTICDIKWNLEFSVDGNNYLWSGEIGEDCRFV